MPRKWVMIVCAVVCLAPSRYSFPAESDLELEFRASAPRGWQRLESAMQHVHGTALYTEEFHHVERGDRGNVTRFRFKIDGDRVLCERIPLGENPVGGSVLDCLNDDYAFRLRRTSETEPWTLEAVEDEGPLREKILLVAKQGWVLRFLENSWKMEGLPMVEMIDHDSFAIKSISKESAEGEELVRVEFDYDPPNKGKLEFGATLGPGWVYLDPARSWAIREYQVQSNGRYEQTHVQLGYNDDVAQAPLVAEAKTEYRGDKGAWTAVWQFEELAEVSTPRSEFRLSAFGIPEPAGFEEPWRLSTPLFLAGVAACLLVAGILLFAVARRRVSAV